jgi:hypothetical protein
MKLLALAPIALWLVSAVIFWFRIRKAPPVKADRSNRLHVLTCPSE